MGGVGGGGGGGVGARAKFLTTPLFNHVSPYVARFVSNRT